MREADPEVRRVEQVERIVARNRESGSERALVCGKSLKLCFDGVSGLRCYEVEVIDADIGHRPGPPIERELGTACEPLN